jgi:hypothetical protein
MITEYNHLILKNASVARAHFDSLRADSITSTTTTTAPGGGGD